MIRSAASKVGWMARATTTVVGLAIMLALVFGVTSMALGANGNPFILGKANNVATKVTGLIGKVASGSALVVKNPSGGSALDLKVGDPAVAPATKTIAPMKVDSQAEVPNLNAALAGRADSAASADTLDGVDSTQFAQKLDSGTTTLDPGPIAAQSCSFLVIDPPGAGDISNDVVVVTPDTLAANTNLVFGTSRASQNTNGFRIRMCNITTSAIDAPSAAYHWMIFHQP